MLKILKGEPKKIWSFYYLNNKISRSENWLENWASWGMTNYFNGELMKSEYYFVELIKQSVLIDNYVKNKKLRI